MTKTDKREKSKKQVKDLLNYFSQKSDKYNEFDKFTDLLYKSSAGRTKTLKYLGICFLVFGGAFLAFWVLSCVPGKSANETLLLVSIFSFVCIDCFIAGIVLLSVNSSLNKKYQRNLFYYTNKYFELADELYSHYLDYDNCPIKASYTNPKNIKVIQKTLLSGKADTINNAITLLSNNETCNKRKKCSKDVAVFAKKTAENTGRSEMAGKMKVVFLPGNYFLKKTK